MLSELQPSVDTASTGLSYIARQLLGFARLLEPSASTHAVPVFAGVSNRAHHRRSKGYATPV